jgi:hypothetical protein
METTITAEQWVWVVVQNPGGNEQFLGQEDQTRGESFIPAFLEKEEAQAGLELLSRDPSLTYEVQAIRFDDLCGRAAQNDFRVFMMTGKGEILEKITP